MHEKWLQFLNNNKTSKTINNSHLRSSVPCSQVSLFEKDKKQDQYKTGLKIAVRTVKCCYGCKIILLLNCLAVM